MRKTKLVMVIAAVMGGLFCLAAAQAGTTAAAPAFAPIRNAETGKCIQGRTNGESDLVQRQCDGTAAQNWIFVPDRNGGQFANQSSELCFYMNGPVSSGSPVIQTGCSLASNNDWKIATPPAVSTIMSKAGFRDTNLCIVPESPSENALLRIIRCDSSSRIQLWSIGIP
jgi:ricin-type beta-trefoil lectin protein